MFETVLVPLDGSEYSERALATGLELARLAGSKVRLITVVLAYPDAHVPAVKPLDDQVRARAEAYMAPFVKQATSAGFEVEGEVAHGEPASEIVRAAHAANAGVIVMSTHGIGATGRHALGSVAMKVLQSAECPVLMVKIPEAAGG